MQIQLPPYLQSLVEAIDAIPPAPDPKKAIEDAKKALDAYNALTPEQRAEYLRTVREEIEEFESKFKSALGDAQANYQNNKTAEGALLTGQLAVQAGRSDLARGYFSDAAKLNPNDQTASDLWEKAEALSHDRAPVQQKIALGRLSAQAARPSSAADYNAQGLSKLLAEDVQGAKKAFEQAVDLDPKNAEYLNNLSLAETYTGLIGEAAESAIEALKANPKIPPNNLLLVTACLRQAVEKATAK